MILKILEWLPPEEQCHLASEVHPKEVNKADKPSAYMQTVVFWFLHIDHKKFWWLPHRAQKNEVRSRVLQTRNKYGIPICEKVEGGRLKWRVAGWDKEAQGDDKKARKAAKPERQRRLHAWSPSPPSDRESVSTASTSSSESSCSSSSSSSATEEEMGSSSATEEERGWSKLWKPWNSNEMQDEEKQDGEGQQEEVKKRKREGEDKCQTTPKKSKGSWE